MNKREAYRLGVEWGRGFSWTDFDPDRDFDEDEHGSVEDAFYAYCYDGDDIARSFSPFEFTARAINTSRDPEGYWNAFDRGMEVGLRKAWRAIRGRFAE